MNSLIHYSAKPLAELRRCEIQDGYKPRGLWVSVEGEDDWFSWCTSKDYHTNRLICQTEILLEPEANILRLSTKEKIKSFSSQYAGADHLRPDWESVAAIYDGIIIAPYCWEARDYSIELCLTWYYGWDCASGCIWNTDRVRIGAVKVLEVAD